VSSTTIAIIILFFYSNATRAQYIFLLCTYYNIMPNCVMFIFISHVRRWRFVIFFSFTYRTADARVILFFGPKCTVLRGPRPYHGGTLAMRPREIIIIIIFLNFMQAKRVSSSPSAAANRRSCTQHNKQQYM